MNNIINNQWRPSSKTSNTLKSDKYGYSQDQLNRLGRIFIERYEGQSLNDASSEFFSFVRKSEVGHNMPKPSREQEEAEKQKRLQEQLNKSENGAERAQEAKEKIAKPESQENDNPELDQMLLNATGSDLRQYLSMGGKCNQKFASAWMKATR